MNAGFPLWNFCQIFKNVNFGLGMLLNSILFYLILCHSGRSLLEYRPILLQLCISDMLYGIMSFLVKPLVDVRHGNFHSLITGFFGDLPQPWGSIYLRIWVFFHFSCTTCISVQFIYRYLIIVRGSHVSIKTYVKMLVFAYFLAFIYALIEAFVVTYDPTTYPEHRAHLLQDAAFEDHVGVVYASSLDHWPLFCMFGYFYVLTLGSYLLILISTIKIIRKLKAMRSLMAISMYKMHSDVTRALICQTLTPLFLIFLPNLWTVSFTFLHFEVPGNTFAISILWSLLPVVNPIFTIFSIKKFRHYIYQKLRHPLKKSKGATSYSSFMKHPSHTHVSTIHIIFNKK